MDFIYQLGGIETAEGDTRSSSATSREPSNGRRPRCVSSEKVHLDHTIFADAFEFLKSTVNGGATPKLTIPSPNMVHYRGGRAAVDERIYPDMEEFWSDLGRAYADELRALGELGCTYLQFDDTSLAYLNDPRQREQIKRARDNDVEHLHEQYVRNINRALEGKPDGMAVTTHLCRGNFRSSWAAEGGYDFVAEALFGGLAVDGFFLEYDDDRSGGFEPLRFVPKGKYVVLGLVTTKHGELESKDALKRRIEEASQLRADRAAVPVTPVRFLVDRRGQRRDARAGDRQARADRRNRGRGLGELNARRGHRGGPVDVGARAPRSV